MRLYITVRFSSDDKLIVEGDQVSISIKSAPERGKANRELIKRLAKHFQVP
ncbi:MAG: YggU family protein, partial [Nitrososphaera sp.]|nr:YggU family protein [Nitrososphaera sp.]